VAAAPRAGARLLGRRGAGTRELATREQV
jgi:hypothetical protein